MREIKFRAWDKKEKEMYDLGRLDIPWPYDEIIIMQFTGLYDKNGKEIYEGDILAAPMANGEWKKNIRRKVFNADVYFSKGEFNFRPHGDIFNGDYRWYPQWNECEVIGNIYENPELLESLTGRNVKCQKLNTRKSKLKSNLELDGGKP